MTESSLKIYKCQMDAHTCVNNVSGMGVKIVYMYPFIEAKYICVRICLLICIFPPSRA